jgi:hypothetical protein
LITAGLPVGPNGGLDREKSLRWIADLTSGYGGGWGGARGREDLAARAQRLLDGAAKPEAKDRDFDPAVYIAWRTCGNLRVELPELLATDYPDLSTITADSFGVRVYALALVTYLCEAWLEDLLVTAPALPKIAWKQFGKRSREARRLAETLQAYWQTGNKELLRAYQKGPTPRKEKQS